MKIRKATMKDASQILKLLNSDTKMSVNGKKGDYNKYDVEDYIKEKNNQTFVYEEDNKILGVIICHFFTSYFYLGSIIVDKNFQRKGIGKKLVKYIETLAKKRGIRYVELITKIENIGMQNLLKKLNYKKGDKFFAYSKNFR
ncbi:GNAT family N-acetyltransferase [Candidatus Pacearchaeota archaeon]|nr:GNAT family N-acetyltransferase [Candidatus Pacearchaeota archaeon]